MKQEPPQNIEYAAPPTPARRSPWLYVTLMVWATITFLFVSAFAYGMWQLSRDF